MTIDRKQNRLAYVSKRSVQELDEWVDAENTKSEDVLVRYRDGRGSKQLFFQPHIRCRLVH